jgi:nucleoside-diphosphate-sugar epimerase
MNILVTGGAGYLGSVLIPKLLARGHRVRVLDVGYFGVEHLRSLRPPTELIREDVRRAVSDPRFCQELLANCDCIIHLAAISNDPSAELNPELTEEVNFQATQILAETARVKRIKFLFSSSCSVYGEAEGEVDEEGVVMPLTTYAVSKVKAEWMLEDLADGTWSPVILRNGTLFGYSQRMRFDLVVNIFSLYNTLYNEIRIFGDGQQWRPFLHVSDCARAFVYFAEKPELRYRCYNIAHENLRVADLAAIFQRINPHLQVTHLELPDQDHRDYRVSARRMQEEGFRTRISVDIGAEEIIEAMVSGLIPDPESIYYRNAKWLKELTQIGSKNHRDVVNLMETLAQVRPSARS